MSDPQGVTDPSYHDAVSVACSLRNVCWWLLVELGRENHPMPATQAELQRLEAENPWLTRIENAPLEERLTREEWRERQEAHWESTRQASMEAGWVNSNVLMDAKLGREEFEALLDVKLQQAKISLMDHWKERNEDPAQDA